MIKLIVSDMDGTLLDDNKNIDEEIYEILPRLKEKGIKFVVASGRQYPSLEKLFNEHIEDVVIIAENGAFAVDNKKELFAEYMSREEIKYCLDTILKFDFIEPILCTKYNTYTRNKEVFELLSSPIFNYNMKMTDDLYNVSEDIIKVSMITHQNKHGNDAYDALKPFFKEKMALLVSGSDCLDTGNLEITKGTAVEYLQKIWNITPEETLVFGDQYNDVGMFSKSYYSYAMEGAADNIKKLARFVAGSNNDGGVVKVIKELTEI